MEKAQAEKGWPSLAVDAGSLLFKDEPTTPETLAQDKVKAEALAAAYSLMQFAAVSVGPGDLAAGVDFLKGLEKKSSFTWLSANLVSKKDGKPLFREITTKKVGKTEVAILGLTAKPLALTAPADGYDLRPWETVLPPLMQKAAKSDMVILLSSLAPEENRAIAKAYSGIHLIVQAPANVTNLPPQPLEGGALLTQTEKQGKSLGILHISWESSKKWRQSDPAAVLREKKGELDRLSWQLDRQKSQGDPEVVFANDPARLNTYRMLRDRKQQLTGEMNRLEAELKAEATSKPSTFASSFIAMETNLPDQPKILELVEETKKKVNGVGKASIAPLPAAPAGVGPLAPDFPYVGWNTCAGCHPEATRNWQASGHARAMEALKAKRENFNLSCIPCHVTGLDAAGESYALQLPDPLQAVGCEVCHGPGRLHARNPAQNRLIAKPGEERCRRCHTPDHDDHFDYRENVKQLGYPLSTWLGMGLQAEKAMK